ncbi:hypothetical protein GCM10023092_03860 [Rurimicrobium arvi]|uniref:DUF8202 domain-containing protein n=2 Tax=Rurimicrobium arvi TaxID=2049916 RepID=A0ABP8MHF8_9BACT
MLVLMLGMQQSNAQFIIRVNTTLSPGTGTSGDASTDATPVGQFFLRRGLPTSGVNITVKDITGTTTLKTYTGVSAGLLIRNSDWGGTETSFQIEYTGVTSFRFMDNYYPPELRGDAMKLTSVEQWGSSVWTTFAYAFCHCENLTRVSMVDAPDLSANPDPNYMFSFCYSLNGGAFNLWDVSNMTSLRAMFCLATSFDQDLSSWDVRKVTNFRAMFSNARNFTNGGVSLSSWRPVSATDMGEMFSTTQYNKPLDWCDTTLQHVTSTDFMFYSNTVFDQDISCWNVSKVTNFYWMFYGASSYTNGGVSLSSWRPVSATEMGYMFGGTKYNKPLDWCDTTLSRVTSLQGMFSGAYLFDQDISCWSVDNVTNFGSMFAGASNYTNAGVSLSVWRPVSALYLSGMFASCKYNLPLNWCDTTLQHVIYTSWMFQGNTVFNQDISCWDVSKVTDMSGMFYGASSYTNAGVSLSVWRPVSVRNMSYMFNSCNYNLPLNWCDTTLQHVTNMSWMFQSNTVFNQDISCWNTRNVADMSGMFSSATGYHRNLVTLEIDNVTNMANMLDYSGLNNAQYDSILIAWKAAPHKTNVTLGAAGFTYCDSREQRASLIANDGWTINYDMQCWTPGGFGTNLSLWLDAGRYTQNSGATVSSGPVDSWGSSVVSSGVPPYFLQSGTSSRPTLSANSLNYNPVMHFDGVNDLFRVSASSSGYRQSYYGSYAVFLIGRFGNSGPVLSHDNLATDPVRSTVSAAGIATDSGTRSESYNVTAAMSGLQLGTYLYRPAYPWGGSGYFAAYMNGMNNGSVYSVNAPLPTVAGDYLVGGNTGGSSFFSGDLAEMVVYSGDYVYYFDRMRVESYLALKWGITLSPGVAYDYISSRSTTVWNGSGTYQYNVFGLGRDSVGSLDQQISKSQTGGDSLVFSTDNNFTGANGSHASIASGHSFLIAGNNYAPMSTTQTSGLPSSLCGTRLSREWRVQATDFNQRVYVQAGDVSALLALAPGATASNIMMVVDTDGDLNFSTGTPSVYTASSLTGNVARFDTVAFVPGGNGSSLFTIMLGNAVPALLPSGSSGTSIASCTNASGYDDYQLSSDLSKVIMSFDPNGNAFAPSSLTVDNSGSLVSAGTGTYSTSGSGYYQMTDGVNSIRLTKRLQSVVAPGSYTTGGGVKVRVYYQGSDTASMVSDSWPGSGSTAFKGWIKSSRHTAHDVVDDLTAGGLKNSESVTPVALGTDRGVPYAEFLVTSFSTFGYVASSTASPLPLHLLSFEARKENNSQALLEWSTGTEDGVRYMDVEHSADGSNWIAIGKTMAKGSNSRYSFTDAHPSAGINLYRLKMVNEGGSYAYGPTRRLDFEVGDRTLNLYPNPAHKELTLSVGAGSLKGGELIVTDVLGQEQHRGLILGDVQEYKLDVSALPKGQFVIRLVLNDQVYTGYVTVQ